MNDFEPGAICGANNTKPAGICANNKAKSAACKATCGFPAFQGD